MSTYVLKQFSPRNAWTIRFGHKAGLEHKRHQANLVKKTKNKQIIN